MDNYTIVTCCNRIPLEPYYILPSFIKSLQDKEPFVLSEQNMNEKWDGLGSKPKWLYRAITEKLFDTKYIIFCDCWDLVLSVHPDNLIQDYKDCFNSPLVISSEKNCFPADLKDEYDKLPFKSYYKYLNSGMIVGETEALLTALESMDLPNVPNDYRQEDGNMFHVNDQFLWMQTFLKQPVKIELDYMQILCNTLHDVDVTELDFTGVNILNTETGMQPCSFHANGGAKTSGIVTPILQHLNLI